MLKGLENPAMRAALAGFFTMAAAMGIGRFVYTPILPLMIEDGALNAAEAGVAAGANYLGYLVGALGASAAFFAPYRRMWMFAALTLSVATTAAMALVPGLAAITAIRFFAGVASAFAMIFVTTIVMAWLAAERRPGLLSLQFGGVGFGIAGSAVLVSLLAAAGLDWRGIWTISGLAGALALLVTWALLPRESLEPLGGDGKAEKDAPFSASLWIYIVGYGFFGFGYVITTTFINAMAKAEPALRPVEPWVWLVVGLAAMPSVWLWNRLAAAITLSRAYAAACLVEAFGVALSVLVLKPAALLLAAVMVGGTFVAATAMGLSRARAMSLGSPARVIALMTASFGIGQMIGPVVAGWLFEQTGSLFSASMLAVAGLVASAFLILFGEARQARS